MVARKLLGLPHATNRRNGRLLGWRFDDQATAGSVVPITRTRYIAPISLDEAVHHCGCKYAAYGVCFPGLFRPRRTPLTFTV